MNELTEYRNGSTCGADCPQHGLVGPQVPRFEHGGIMYADHPTLGVLRLASWGWETWHDPRERS